MHKIFIGIPVFNGENFLSAAIESILGQTYGDFSLVISDNASTDGTEDLCRSFSRDKRLQYIRQPHNLGAAGNHNYLFRRSEAPYFKWAAHDDVMAPTFLETCVKVLERESDVVLASPATSLIDEEGLALPYSVERGGIVDRAGICWPMVPEDNPKLMAPDPAVRFEAVMSRIVMCVEIFGLMRRSALERTSLQGPFGGADKVLLAQMSLLGRFWLGEEVLFYRRCHARQFSASASGAYRAHWFSAQRDSMFRQQVKLMLAYVRSLSTGHLTARQRYNCIRAIFKRAASRGHHWRRLTGALVGNP